MFEDETPMNDHVTRSYAMVSTYPPTQCGIATFAAALSGGLYEYGDDVGIVRVGADGEPPAKIVVAELNDQDGHETIDAMDELNRADVVIVQHEYGIYDGPDGESIVQVLEGIDRPTIVVAHTVLEHPTPHQRSVLEAVVRAADAVVVMTEAGRVRLCTSFDVDTRKISVIPHGAAVSDARTARGLQGATETPHVGTARTRQGHRVGDRRDGDGRRHPTASRIYIVAGKTHPKVQGVRGRRLSRHVDPAREGSPRRRGLRRQVPNRPGALATDQRVDDGDPALRLARSGDLGRTGRRDRRRTSRSSRPPSRTPSNCSRAARASWCRDATPRRWPTPSATALTTPGMVKADGQRGPPTGTGVGVARDRRALRRPRRRAARQSSATVGEPMTERPRFDHLVALTDRFGTFEHAEHATPRREHGYCVDDVARVLVVGRARTLVRTLRCVHLAQGSLGFVGDAMGPHGDCRQSSSRRWHVDERRFDRGLLGSKPLGTRHGGGQSAVRDRRTARSSSSSEAPNSAPSIRAPWPSPPWVRRPCSAFIRRTPAALSLMRDAADTHVCRRATTQRGPGPSRASTTPTHSCPTP